MIYWIESGPLNGSGSLWRSSSDGSNVAELVAGSLDKPHSLSIDLSSQTIYISDIEEENIVKVDLVTEEVDVLVDLPISAFIFTYNMIMILPPTQFILQITHSRNYVNI